MSTEAETTPNQEFTETELANLALRGALTSEQRARLDSFRVRPPTQSQRSLADWIKLPFWIAWEIVKGWLGAPY